VKNLTNCTLTYNGHDHHIFINHEDPTCFICKSSDHKSANCTKYQEKSPDNQESLTATQIDSPKNQQSNTTSQTDNINLFQQKLEEARNIRDKNRKANVTEDQSSTKSDASLPPVQIANDQSAKEPSSEPKSSQEVHQNSSIPPLPITTPDSTKRHLSSTTSNSSSHSSPENLNSSKTKNPATKKIKTPT